MRESERAVMERLMTSHPLLTDGKLHRSTDDPPDAIVVCERGRFGFELTDIFSVGGSNARGSEYLQFDRVWQDVKRGLIETLRHQHANLDQCDIYLWLDGQSAHSFDIVNLPKLSERRQFGIQLMRAIFAHRPAFNEQSDRAVDVMIPSTPYFALLRRYVSRVEVIWRPDSYGEVNIASRVHLPAVEGGYLNTGTEKLEAAILRKGHPTRDQMKRIKAADVHEMYLVLGGQRTGLLPHLQGQTRALLERDLAFVRYVFELSVFHGIILFDDFSDTAEVFCTRCLAARQKERRVGIGPLDFFSPGMFDIPHACAALTTKIHASQRR